MSELSKLVGTLLDAAAREITAVLLEHPSVTEPEKDAEPKQGPPSTTIADRLTKLRVEQLKAVPGHPPAMYGAQAWCNACQASYPCAPVKVAAQELYTLSASLTSPSSAATARLRAAAILLQESS